ncbi:MAG: hypothetical protein V3S19_07165 [Gemmatimonadales bacterium]
MIPTFILKSLEAHHHEARTKYAPFADIAQVILKLQDRLSKVSSAAGSDADAHQLPEIGRRLIQLAAIAIRATNDLSYLAAPPKSPPDADPPHPPLPKRNNPNGATATQ